VIDSLRSLLTDSAFPSLHVLVVHFPIALVSVALLFDIGCLFFRRRVWLDRAATTLYVMGTIGAGAAYLTGRRAAGALLGLGPGAESALADHRSLAVITLVAFAGVSLVRLIVSWLARHDRRIHIGIFRLLAIPVAIAGLAVLAVTADHGGRLVYRHGVGVTVESPDTAAH